MDVISIMEEDSTRRKSRDDNSSNNSYVVPAIVTTYDNSEIVNDATTAVEEPSKSGSENDGDELLFKPLPIIIPKVPLVMRNHENNKGVFDPKAVSIGPYHHGKPELQFVENFKPMVAKLFVSDSPSGKNKDEFYNEVLKKVDDARSYYVEGSIDECNREEFAKMMFLDGCFILALIEMKSNILPGLHLKYDELPTHLGLLVLFSSFTDIIYLLENQLPFQVLELLMSLKFKDDEGLKMIHLFAESLVTGEFKHIKKKKKKKVEVNETEKQPLHLLQLVRAKLLNLPLHIRESQRSINKHKFLSKILKIHFVNKDKYSLPKHNVKDFVYSFRSVTELKAKGIHFKPSSSLSFKAIKFEPFFFFFGRLQLPPFLLVPDSKIQISNMIAYELCFASDGLDYHSFICFLKSLIDSPDDVKELRSKRILFNMLGSDEQVANLYKEITTFGVGNIQIYEEVKQSIQNHYNNIAKTWMAEFINKYFSRPWTVIAFIAATSLLILAFLQTYFTISPLSSHK